MSEQILLDDIEALLATKFRTRAESIHAVAFNAIKTQQLQHKATSASQISYRTRRMHEICDEFLLLGQELMVGAEPAKIDSEVGALRFLDGFRHVGHSVHIASGKSYGRRLDDTPLRTSGTLTSSLSVLCTAFRSASTIMQINSSNVTFGS